MIGIVSDCIASILYDNWMIITFLWIAIAIFGIYGLFYLLVFLSSPLHVFTWIVWGLPMAVVFILADRYYSRRKVKG